MPDSLAGQTPVISSSGEVNPNVDHNAESPPGFAHSIVTCGPGVDTELLPYDASRAFASVQNKATGKTVLISVGEVFASPTVYTLELAPGDLWEMPTLIVTTAIHCYNPNLVNVDLVVTEGDIFAG